MSNTAEIIKKEMEKSDGHARMVRVPPEKRPTLESIEKMQREVNAQIDTNHIMRENSHIEK